MQRAMDINSDVGESFGNYSFGVDAEIMPHLSSAEVVGTARAAVERMQVAVRPASTLVH